MAESQSRKLAAILAADIAGYSALMGADEARTVRDLKDHQAVALPMVGAFGGRIIDTAGDGILAEFASIVKAVECAVAIQRTMAQRNASVDPARRMQFRIGVNLGDLIYDEARIYGDGVNIAARLEGLAEPGGVCLSRQAYEQIEGKVPLSFRTLGPQTLKNIAKSVEVFAVEHIGRYADGSNRGVVESKREPPSLGTGEGFGLIVADREYVRHHLRWSDRRLLEELRELDHAIVPALEQHDLRENPHEADLDELIPVYTNEPDTWRLILTADKILVGYWHFDVLKEDKYEQARLGILLDRDMTSEAIIPFAYGLPGWYDIYIAFFGVAPAYYGAKVNAFQRLMQSFIDVIALLCDDERDIYIGRVSANTLTPYADRLCCKLGMNKVAKHAVTGFVWEGTMQSILRSWRERVSGKRRHQCDELLVRYATRDRLPIRAQAQR